MKRIYANLRRLRAFTLVELLIVIVVLAVLAAIVIPKFADSGTRSKESSLRSDLSAVRGAIDTFKADTGAYPAALADLAGAAAPASGKNADASTKTINAGDYKGPYLAAVPKDPVSASDLNYSVTAGSVGAVSASASGTDSNGVNFNTY